MKPGTLAAIHRVRLHHYKGCPTDGSPYVIDCRSFDIDQTVIGMINNAPPGLVAVTLSPRGGCAYVKTVERAARKRGIRILWWTFGTSKEDPWGYKMADERKPVVEITSDICGCQRCQSDYSAKHPRSVEQLFAGPSQPGWRYACEICGNKRCPHHADHTFVCTGLNTPGQVGVSASESRAREYQQLVDYITI